jgi:O-antigen/teichoic acid export membrane protein
MINNFIKNLSKTFFTVNLGNLLNYLTTIIIIKSITVEDFSLITSFFSVLFFFSLPNLVLTQFILKLQHIVKNNYQIFKLINIYILIITLTNCVLIYFLKDIFKSKFNLLDIKNFEIYITLTSILSLYYQFLSSLFLQKRFYMTYNYTTSAFFLIKFIIVLCLYIFDKGNVEILIIINILAYILSIIVLVFFLNIFLIFKNIFKDNLKIKTYLNNSKIFKNLISVFISQFLLYGTLNYDILICRTFCDEFNSGLYGAATTISKIIYFLIIAVSTIFLREIFYLKNKKKYLLLLLILLSPILISYNLTYYFFSEKLLNIFLDQRYNSIEFIHISTFLNLGMSFMILSSFLINFFLTLRFNFYYRNQIIITIIGFVLTFAYNNQNPYNISFIFLATSLLIFISLLLDFKNNNNK